MLAHWVWFAHRPGLGDRGKVTVLQHFSCPEEIYFAAQSSFDHIPGLTSEAKEALNDKDMTKAEEILELCRRGYTVYVGKSSDGEIDFAAVRQNEKIYVQVTQEIRSEKTEKRTMAL